MNLAATLMSRPAWASSRRAGDDIVMATIGRLVRNLRDCPFPGWSTEESRAEAAAILLPALKALPECRGAWHAELSELSYESRRALLGNKLLTPCMAARGKGCHLILPKNRRSMFLINEEEHLVVHSFRCGSACAAVTAELLALGERLSAQLPVAYDPAFGYLTSLPGEAGDGIQLYQVLHLPALTMAGMMTQVTRAAEKLHINISPYYADGQDDTGNTYVFFSIPGPQGSAEELSDYFESVMQRLCERELQVRRKLQDNSAGRLQDCIGRAYGLLRYARRLSLKELRDACSVLRLATVLGHLEWEGGANAAVDELRELVRRLSVETALATETQEENQPQLRADAVRCFLTTTPHHFNPIYA